MKKVVITGHTKGIGKAIFDYFVSKGYEVIGFSRSTGYNISNLDHRKTIIEELKSADIFVNNAYVNFDDSQLSLLTSAFELWADNAEKLIINISSRAAGTAHNKYSLSKLKLDYFCNSKLYEYPQILNFKPGLVDTDRVKDIAGQRMSLDQMIEILDFAVSSRHVKIQSITLGA